MRRSTTAAGGEHGTTGALRSSAVCIESFTLQTFAELFCDCYAMGVEVKN
jgi:hypothetical protein